MIDLTTIPDEDLKREYMRRLNERRRRVPGGLKVMRPCIHCKKEFSAREMRVHVPQCEREHVKPGYAGNTATVRQWLWACPAVIEFWSADGDKLEDGDTLFFMYNDLIAVKKVPRNIHFEAPEVR